MNLAHREFGVPKVLEPEYLASPWLDELSGMTYLSYFMKPDGPGYNATKRWVNSQIKVPVHNFTVSIDLSACLKLINVNFPSLNCRLTGMTVAYFVKSSKVSVGMHQHPRK